MDQVTLRPTFFTFKTAVLPVRTLKERADRVGFGVWIDAAAKDVDPRTSDTIKRAIKDSSRHFLDFILSPFNGLSQVVCRVLISTHIIYLCGRYFNTSSVKIKIYRSCPYIGVSI